MLDNVKTCWENVECFRSFVKYPWIMFNVQFNSIQFNFISIKTLQQKYIKKKDIYTTKSYGGVGWKANEAW